MNSLRGEFRKIMLRGLWPLLVTAMLSACFSISAPEEIPPESEALCNFDRHRLSVSENDVDPKMAAALKSNGDLLFLSGGGQHGAFGAGFLEGWAKGNEDKLPEFSIVTGVSTGALLSLAAFTNTPKDAALAYSIDKESDALKPYVSGGKLSVFDYLAVSRKGAVGDLSPVKDKLLTRLRKKEDGTEGWVEKINARYKDEKLLFVVATNIDTGYAEAFDMTEMASRIYKAREDKDFKTEEKFMNCFANALIASSSVPLAAKPIFIDNIMYIDGGARFGIMNEMIGQILEKNKEFSITDISEKKVYVLINGDQEVSNTCEICGPQNTSQKHKNWSLLGLAERSVSILTDQIYQFSEAKIQTETEIKRRIYTSLGTCAEVIRLSKKGQVIDAGVLKHCENIIEDEVPNLSSPDIINLENDDLGRFTHELDGDSKTCLEWRSHDKETSSPIEFHPKYMNCLIAYGNCRAEKHFSQPDKNCGESQQYRP